MYFFFKYNNLLTIKLTIQPAEAAIVVFAAIFPILELLDVDPQLNPYHPNHNISVPKEVYAIEWG